MMAAGMGAGVGAIFRAPLAGAIFAGEILYREADLESEVIVPAAISSIVAYSVYCLSLPVDKRFTPDRRHVIRFEPSGGAARAARADPSRAHGHARTDGGRDGAGVPALARSAADDKGKSRWFD